MLHPNSKSVFDAVTQRDLNQQPLSHPTLVFASASSMKAAADNDMQRNIAFVQKVVTCGQTIYDGYGTAIHHTTDLGLVGEVLDATGDRHFGVHMTGIRPL